MKAFYLKYFSFASIFRLMSADGRHAVTKAERLLARVEADAEDIVRLGDVT